MVVGIGRSQWKGQGRGLGYRLCQSIKAVLAEDGNREFWSRRAREQMAELRQEFTWLDREGTAVVTGISGRSRGWTIAGSAANAALANEIAQTVRSPLEHGSFSLTFESTVSADAIAGGIEQLRAGDPAEMRPEIDEEAIEGLKFNECLSGETAVRMLEARLGDLDAVRRVLGELVRFVVQHE